MKISDMKQDQKSPIVAIIREDSAFFGPAIIQMVILPGREIKFPLHYLSLRLALLLSRTNLDNCMEKKNPCLKGFSAIKVSPCWKVSPCRKSLPEAL